MAPTPKPAQRKKVVGGRFLYGGCSPERGPLKGMIPRVFPNLRRTHKYKHLPLRKQLSFYLLPSFSFCKKKSTSMGTWEIIIKKNIIIKK
jgi:hypothetical protein